MRPFVVLALLGVASANGQTVTLTPAVVQLAGAPGQSTTQTLTIRNGTSVDLAFDLVAEDVVIVDGSRQFRPAGATRGGIARTAVFSRPHLDVPAGESASVAVTVTLPPDAGVRAIVALFRGATRVRVDGKPATASLGTLLTFTLSDRESLSAEKLDVEPQSDTANAAVAETLVNDGAEPVLAKGVAVVIDSAGAIVGRTAFVPHRFLPGERARLRSEYPGELASGNYHVLATIEFAGRVVTRTADLEVR